MTRVFQADRRATVSQITACYNPSMQYADTSNLEAAAEPESFPSAKKKKETSHRHTKIG